MRRAAKVDANHNDIVDVLRAAGFSVQSLGAVGSGCPDLLVGVRGYNVLLEVKQPGEKLNTVQKPWHAGWRGTAHVVWTVQDAVMVCGDYARRGCGDYEGRG